MCGELLGRRNAVYFDYCRFHQIAVCFYQMSLAHACRGYLGHISKNPCEGQHVLQVYRARTSIKLAGMVDRRRIWAEYAMRVIPK